MGLISLTVAVNSVPSLPVNLTAYSSVRCVFVASYNNNRHRNTRKRRLPKNLQAPRQLKLPPEFGTNQFLRKRRSQSDMVIEQEEEEEEEEEEECDEIVWESDEIEAITSLFQRRIPQKPGKLIRERSLPLPLPYKTRPLGLPNPKKRVRKTVLVYKNPSVLISIAREIKSLPMENDVSLVLDRWGPQFLRKGSLSMTIRELGQLGLPERALQVLCWAQNQPCLSPDDRTLASTVEVLARSRVLKVPPSLEKFVASARLGVIEAMVRGFSRGGTLSLALKLLLEAKKSNRILDAGVYAKVIMEVAKNPDRHVITASLLDELGDRQDLNLTQQDCTGLMKVCIRLGRFETVESLYNWFKKSGHEPSVVMYTTLIHSWCLEERYREALAVVWEMEGLNCLFDLPCYRVVIKLFVALGDIPRASRYFSKLKESGFSPTYDIYRDLINLYMVSGRIAKVRDMCKEAEMVGLKVDNNIMSQLRQLGLK